MFINFKELIMKIGAIGGAGNLPPKMGPDAYARQYAQQKGISFEEAKAELRAKFGDPKPPGQV